MPHDRILATVKTYPTLSRKYGETVCTAGIREDGSWVRIYPVPFRGLDQEQQYRKYDWIECRLEPNSSDPRPETFRPPAFEQIRRVGHLDTSRNWFERRRLLLEKATVYSRLEDLIEGAKANRLSLAVFKPSRVLDFTWEDEERDWDQDRLREWRERHRQLDLFADSDWERTFSLIQKLPYSFSYKFEDASGRRSELQILDWETGALYWNCLKSCNYVETEALDKVKRKYFETFLKTDLHFFLAQRNSSTFGPRILGSLSASCRSLTNFSPNSSERAE
jgi:hypothetical protein